MTLDSSDPASSPIWSATSVIGGNGHASNGNCILDGPFRDLRPNYADGLGYYPHYIRRAFNDGGGGAGLIRGREYSPAVLAGTQAIPDHDRHHTMLEGVPHGAIHRGDMAPGTSPNGASLLTPYPFARPKR